jgi:hypothetical protein
MHVIHSVSAQCCIVRPVSNILSHMLPHTTVSAARFFLLHCLCRASLIPDPSCFCRTVAAIANDPDFHLSLKLQPGDLEIIHNPSTLHSRTKIVDGEVRGRLLLSVLFCDSYFVATMRTVSTVS